MDINKAHTAEDLAFATNLIVAELRVWRCASVRDNDLAPTFLQMVRSREGMDGVRLMDDLPGHSDGYVTFVMP